MNKTKIEWCDSTWNPITGCLHGCEYCYAVRIAKRFGGGEAWDRGCCYSRDLHVLFTKPEKPYPFYFEPTLHSYRLDEPNKIKKQQNIFVGSMADIFGDWVPDEWISNVFEACGSAPQHRYLFLTKNPKRYMELQEKVLLPDRHWYGYTAATEKDLWIVKHAEEVNIKNLFISIEPIQESISLAISTHCPADWVIIGTETGNRKNKAIARAEWIDEIKSNCSSANVPVFMKDSLVSIVGEENMRREFPWKEEGEETYGQINRKEG
jgi:protein gp37